MSFFDKVVDFSNSKTKETISIIILNNANIHNDFKKNY